MLVGRADEQRAADALLSAARIGQSGVLVFVGEAGIGKSALLNEVAARAHGMRLLRVAGSESERDLPFAGLAQLLRPTAVDLRRLPPPQADALGVALALRPGRGVDRFAVAAASLTLLTQLGEERPVCLLVDDAHLLDRPSQQVMGFVARRLLADAVLLVAAARTGEDCLLVADDLPSRTLTGLDAEATRSLVRGRLGRPGPVLADQVHSLTGGNPLAIIELAADPDRLLGAAPGSPTPVPVTLSAVYTRRAATLGPAGRLALLVAATAGDDLGLVARACSVLGTDVAALADAERAGLVSIERDRVAFAHPLARSAIYALASPGERRRLHGAVAAALADGDPDRRAWHRCEAALGPDDGAADDMDALGRRAADRGAHAVAATAFDRAARLSTTDEVRAERRYAAGSAAWHAGDGQWARSLLEAAIDGTGSALFRAQVGRLLGIIAARTGSLDDARRRLLTAAKLSAGVDRGAAIICFAEAINACFYLGDAASALEAAEQVEAILEHDEPPRPEAALGLMAAGMARVLAGRGGTTQIRTAVAMQGAATVGAAVDTELAAWQVLGPLFVRDSTTGRDLVRRAVAEQRAQAAIGTLPHLLFHIARDRAATDDWRGAEADYAEAITIAREFGQTTELAASLAGLAWLEARQGRSAETLAHATEAETLSVEHDIHVGRAWVRFALGDLALATGNPAEAASQYGSLVTLLAGIGVADVDLSPLPELAEALTRIGRRDEAGALAAEYLERADAKGQPWAMARARRTRGLVAPDDEVDAWFSAAIGAHAQTLDRYEESRTRLVYGARLRRMRRRVDARPVLQAALDTFAELGARPWAAIAADELVATGATARRDLDQPIDQLTPRELQIAMPLAEGKTTRQVAAALFVSPKTVEYHLRHIYWKFGIDSRAELKDRMRPGSGS